MKSLLIFLSISAIPLFTGCTTTNYNDVMSQWVAMQGEVAKIEAQARVDVANAEALKAKALANANQGGVELTLENGQTIKYSNPNMYVLSQGKGFQAAADFVQRKTIPLPNKPTPTWIAAANTFLGVAREALNPLADFGIAKYTMDANVRIADSNNSRMIEQYKSQTESQLGMYSAFSGFGSDMKELGQSYGSEMKQMGTSYSNNMSDSFISFSENFKNDYTQIEKYDTREVIESNESSSSSSQTTYRIEEEEAPVETPIP